MTEHCVLLVGTPKGAFILDSDADRRDWRMRGPAVRGLADPRHLVEPGTSASSRPGGSPWCGPAVWRSDDLGATWTHSSEGLTYGDDGPRVTTVWNVTATGGRDLCGRRTGWPVPERGRRRDLGRTSRGSRRTRRGPTGQPGAGGLILHTIVPHPTDPARMWVGISAVGVFETRDGGGRGRPRNRGVRADFHPDPYPEFGQCVHKLVLASGGTERSTSRTTAASTGRTTAASPGTRSPRACPASSASSWSLTHATRTPSGRSR